MSVKRIRRAVRDGSYEFTTHALEEMDEDALTDEDVKGYFASWQTRTATH